VGTTSIRLGRNAGQTGQSTNAVALGEQAGNNSQGANAVAIGYLAGQTGQREKSIVINAQGTALNTGATGTCFVAPIRNPNQSYENFLNYDTTTKEVVYNYLILPVGGTSVRPSPAVTGMMRVNTDITNNPVEYYNGTSWLQLAIQSIIATGGTITDVSIGGISYRLHTFTTTGTSTFQVLGGYGDAQVLIVGGGGAGGFGHGGGGGGGAVLYNSAQTLTINSYSITVGSGGSATTSDDQNNPGNPSSAFGVTATGGGSGANEVGNDLSGRTGNGGNGANSGGGSYTRSPGTATAPTAVGWTVYAGFSGGSGYESAAVNYGCGGGGGAGENGGSCPPPGNGGNGGNGVLININGNNWYWGGGGGGATFSIGAPPPPATSGNGGLGGGGGGCSVGGIPGTGGGSAINSGENGQNGAELIGGAGGANSGGGGGGGANENATGGAGGSGIVIIRYRIY
jgi:hypothetical protein